MAMNLEAMEQIRQRKAKYCRYLDKKLFDAWESIFAPDATITFYNIDGSVIADFKSIAELSALTRELFATTQTIHQTHNSEIEFKSATEASAIWSMEDWHIYSAEGGNSSKTMHGYGFYHEIWKLLAGEWMLARMELRRSIIARA
jgi:hypothetical protein